MDLSGSAEQSGDLKSVVLHSMTLANVKSDFVVRKSLALSLSLSLRASAAASQGRTLTSRRLSSALGVKLTGVDSATYGLTGEAYSTIVPPMTESNTARILQKDDVALAYEFARKVKLHVHSNAQ